MLASRLTFLFFSLLFLISFRSKSEVFTVTSNEESGTGTLREALTRASVNGVAEKDFIFFNLPDLSEAGRTIVINGRLPNVSSNLSIDASTQAGSFFGISTARVQIQSDFPPSERYPVLALISVHDIEIYALYIRNLKPYVTPLEPVMSTGIMMRDTKSVQIGAEGKGNVICGFNNDLEVNTPEHGGQAYLFSENLILKSNFISVEADGATLSLISSSPTAISYTYGRLIIGGAGPEGNLFPKGFSIWQSNAYDYTDPGTEHLTLPAEVDIVNNKIGVDYAISRSYEGSSGIYIATHFPYGKNTMLIKDNVIFGSSYGIHISNEGREIKVINNYIGTDKTLNKKFPINGSGIFVYGARNVKIGSEQTKDANYIANCKPLLVWPGSVVSVNKNSFFCTVDAYPMLFLSFGEVYPSVEITSIDAASVSGIATPGASIELFYSDLCGTCSPETYFGSTTADDKGNWKYKGPIAGDVIASATFNNKTSEFTKASLDETAVTVTHTCTNTGSIKGLVPKNTQEVKWYNENGKLVGTEADLLSVSPGKYKLQTGGGACTVESKVYEVQRAWAVDFSKVIATNSTCGLANGAVKGVKLTGPVSGNIKYSWKNSKGEEVGQQADLVGVPPGEYSLFISAAGIDCKETFGPVAITNSSGPYINDDAISVRASECGVSTGAITGLVITGSGPLSIEWKNADGRIVGNAKDLINQPAGQYVLELRDQSGCASVFSSAMIIPELNGVIMQDDGRSTPATCTNNDGSISGILVSGADKFDWFDKENRLVFSTPTSELKGVAAGEYYLIASNSSCSQRSKRYTIPKLENSTLYGQPIVVIRNADCDMDNGSVQVTFSKAIPVAYRWVDQSTGKSIASNTSYLQGLHEGTYQLFVGDGNACEVLIDAYTIKRDPKILKPDVSDLEICNPGPALLSIRNASGPYSYRIYQDYSSLTPLDEQASGTFNIDVREDRSYFVSRFSESCESEKIEVKVKIGSGGMKVSNVFTPNGDGQNDTWDVTGILSYPRASVSVFNRYGTKVFESKGYAAPFDGTFNGSALPEGAYYYIIEVGLKCGPLSGSLSILR